MKNVLIVGSNFNNKGAQSMLFVTVDEIKKRLEGCNIYYAGCDEFNEDKYSFLEFYYSEEAKNIALATNKLKEIFHIIKAFSKDMIKWVLGKRINLWKYMYIKNNIKNIDFIIDISGFNLGDKWDDFTQNAYIKNIMLAKKFNIPMYLMPQSFGPFNNYDNRKELLEKIEEYLKYPRIIFAREKDGYNKLMKGFGLNNVLLSTDLVLQNKEVDMKNIYKSENKVITPDVLENSVAIVPNTQCFKHGNGEKIIETYKNVIDLLLEEEKNVYIFRHSREDLNCCKKIKECYSNNSKVKIIDNDFTCIEYDNFIKKFQFIICSRYHGIVHAYKNYIPCILLGWAIKYNELADNVEQSKYVFNITETNFNDMYLLNEVKDMLSNLNDNRNKIKNNVTLIQKNNCFDEVFKDVKK